jgi:hypothetical protein
MLQIVDATFNASYLLCIQGNYGIRPCSNRIVLVAIPKYCGLNEEQQGFPNLALFIFYILFNFLGLFFFPCYIQGHSHFDKKLTFDILNQCLEFFIHNG